MKVSSCSRWVVALLLAWPATIAAQFTEPPPPAAYAIQGVTLVSADGNRRAGVTVVVRGQLIEALGQDVAVPPDAEVLEGGEEGGEGLFLYPGFIDAQGEAEYAFPEQSINMSEVAAWDPPRYVQSFMPHRRVADYLTATGSSLDNQRKAGVVAAVVLPTGRLMPGQGTLIMLRADAAMPSELVIAESVGPLMSLQGAQGVYPQRLFTVIAFYRQSFEDARHLAAHQEAYDRGRAGVSAPAWDPDLEVLQDAMSGNSPVFFQANLARDIERILGLAEEYGFRPVIVGGEEAWRVTDELKSSKVPVLVSLDFPEPERWEPEEKKSGGSDDAEPGDGGRDGSNGAGSAQEEGEGEGEGGELDAAAAREKQRLEDIYANAGRLTAAGVVFALTSGGGEADILEGTRKAIEYGLAEDDALRALTSTPAALFGIERVARVEAGGSATFIVSEGPLFGEDSKIVYTLVEGDLERAGKGPAEPPSVDVSGTWEVTTESQRGTDEARLTLTQEGSSVEGTYSSHLGDRDIQDGRVSGDEISFTIVAEFGDRRVTLEFTGTVEGDEVSGEGRTPGGSFTWTARRIGEPEGGGEIKR